MDGKVGEWRRDFGMRNEASVKKKKVGHLTWSFFIGLCSDQLHCLCYPLLVLHKLMELWDFEISCFVVCFFFSNDQNNVLKVFFFFTCSERS